MNILLNIVPNVNHLITSFLTLPKLKPIVNSLEELAASDTCKLTAEKNSAFIDAFLVRKPVILNHRQNLCFD